MGEGGGLASKWLYSRDELSPAIRLIRRKFRRCPLLEADSNTTTRGVQKFR